MDLMYTDYIKLLEKMYVWEHMVHVEVASCDFADLTAGIANSNLNYILNKLLAFLRSSNDLCYQKQKK